MRFYRVEFATVRDGSIEIKWYTVKAKAQAEAREFYKALDHGPHFHDEMPEVKTVDIEPTRNGILEALMYYASHPNNG